MKKIVLSTLLMVSIVSAEVPKKGVTALGDDTRALLVEEMLHIEKGMQEIFSYMVKGDYESIVPIASDIHDSFILKKKLTKAQAQDLKEHLPMEFIKLDGSFHELAGKLTNAAEFAEKEKVLETFSDMSKKCVKCHSTYATHRFFRD